MHPNTKDLPRPTTKDARSRTPRVPARRPVRGRPTRPATGPARQRLDRPGSTAQQAFLAGIQNKADLLEAGYGSGLAAPAPTEPPEALLLTGMGGSGAVGRLLQDAGKHRLRTPMHLVRDHDLPTFVQAGTHVLGFSHSGDTEETLSVVAEAQKRGCPVTVFTTGGRLGQMVDDPILQPGGMAPRVALAHVWGSALGFLVRAGVLTEDPGIRRAAAAVRAVDASCDPQVPETENPAKLLARGIEHRVPQIYTTPSFEAVGDFFAALLNENAKRIAHVATVPECNHNALTGWSGDAMRRRYAAVVLQKQDESTSIARRLEYMAKRHEAWDVPWYVYPSGPIRSLGDHVVEQAAGLQFLDYVSFYAAMLQDVDPAEIKEVQGLKAHLGGGGPEAPASRPDQVPA